MFDKNILARLFAILVIASLVLAACGPAATPTEAPAQPAATEAPDQPAATEAPAEPMDEWADVDPSGQTVIFWHQHTRAREESLLKIVNDFNANNEWGITVEAEFQGSYGDIFNKMLGVLNTPDAPGIVVAYQNQAATYQLADGLVDMNGMVNSPEWGLSAEEQADFFPGFWKQDVFPTYGNARLAFPPNRSMEVMYYNIEWLAELKAAGAIDFDGPPTTPEQFKAAACAAVENPFSKAAAEGSMGYELSVDASRFAQLPGVSDVRTQGTAVSLRLHDGIDAVIKLAAEHTVLDMRVEHPSLDEVFMGYYEGATVTREQQ